MEVRFAKGYLRVILLVFICTFCVATQYAAAQRDLLVTQAGEQIRCRILDETPVRFVFAYLKDGKPYRSEIFKSLVASFKFNHYESDLPDAKKLPEGMYQAVSGTDAQPPKGSSSTVNVSSEKKKSRKESKASEVANETTNQIAVSTKNSKIEIEKEISTIEEVGSKKKQESQKLPPKSASSSKSELPEKPLTEPQILPKKKPNQEQEDSRKPGFVKPDSLILVKQTSVDTAGLASGSGSRNSPKAQIMVAPPIPNPVTENSVTPKNEHGIPVEVESRSTTTEVIATPPGVGAEPPNVTINQNNRFRVGIKSGIGNRLDNNLTTTNSYDLYLEQLLRGWVFGADIAYFPADVVGFGAIFTDFKSRNSNNDIFYRNELTGAEQIGSLTNNRSVKFIGPALFLRKKLDYKTYVILGVSPGYNFYRDRGSYDGLDYMFRGEGFGAASTLGIDFLVGNDVVGRNLILSFEAGYNYGQINALDYGDARGLVSLANPLDISRLDFTIGLRLIRLPRRLGAVSF